MDLQQYIDKDGCCTIPDGVKIIKEHAFQNCTNLKKISIPRSVTEIQGSLSGAGAFDGCSNLTDVFLYSSSAKIGPLAFSNCSGLKKFVCHKVLINNGLGFNVNGDYATIHIGNALIPAEFVIEMESRRRIYSGLRQYINESGHCIIPNSVTKIKCNEFMDCKSLKSVSIPDSVTKIGLGAFCGCPNLQKIFCSKKLIDKKFSSSGDTALVYIGGNACVPAEFIVETESGENIYYGLRQFIDKDGLCIIPNNLTTIKNGEFSNCNLLKSIFIPEYVTQIGKGAFEYCNNLSEISIPDSIVQIGSNAFEGCSNLKKLICPKHLISKNNSNQEMINIGNAAVPASIVVEKEEAKASEDSYEEVTAEESIIEKLRYRFEELEFAKKRTQEALQQEKIAFDELKKVVMQYNNMKNTFVVSQIEDQIIDLSKTVGVEGVKINSHASLRRTPLRKSCKKTVSFGEVTFSN